MGKEIDKSPIKRLKEIRKKHDKDISINGLEAGLASLTQTENILVDAIKPITARYILESKEKLHTAILEENTGLKKCKNYILKLLHYIF